MEVRVTTKNMVSTQKVILQLFKKHSFDSELRAMAHEGVELGSLTYTVDVSPAISTDQLTEDILSLDEPNIEGIEWSQKKSFSYLYQ